jgi:hypothetical protein
MRRQFVLRDVQAIQFMMEWLSPVHRGLESIRRLTLYNFSLETHGDLLLRCTALRSLTVQRQRSPCYPQTISTKTNNPEMFHSLRKLQELHWKICHFTCKHEMSAVVRSKLAVVESVSIFVHANHNAQQGILIMDLGSLQNYTIQHVAHMCCIWHRTQA